MPIPRISAGALREARPGQRHQRQRPALAPVVGAQHEGDIFDGDDERQRPDDQRQHAEHVVARRPARRRSRRAAPRGRHRSGWCRYRRTPRRARPASAAGASFRSECVLAISPGAVCTFARTRPSFPARAIQTSPSEVAASDSPVATRKQSDSLQTLRQLTCAAVAILPPCSPPARLEEASRRFGHAILKRVGRQAMSDRDFGKRRECGGQAPAGWRR